MFGSLDHTLASKLNNCNAHLTSMNYIYVRIALYQQAMRFTQVNEQNIRVASPQTAPCRQRQVMDEGTDMTRWMLMIILCFDVAVKKVGSSVLMPSKQKTWEPDMTLY